MVRHIILIVSLLTFGFPVLAIPHPSGVTKINFYPIKLDISPLQPGQMMTFEWQGMPVSVYYRTENEIKALYEDNPLLADSNSEHQSRSDYLIKYHDTIHLDSDWVKTPKRSVRAKYFVFLLPSPLQGCAVKLNVNQFKGKELNAPEGWDGTFFDPCDEVYYDAAGRVFKHDKARYNLYVPNYHFISDSAIELLPESFDKQ